MAEMPEWFDGAYDLYNPMEPPLPLPTSDPLSGSLSSLCFNQEWEPYVRGAIKILARMEIWASEDVSECRLAVARVHTLLAQTDHGCGGLTSVSGTMLGGAGLPPCGPALVPVTDFGAICTYDSILDQITGAQQSGHHHLTFHCTLDLAGLTGFTVTRVQAAWRTNTTETPGSGANDDNYIKVAGTTVAYHGIPGTWSGVDNFTLDSGGISAVAPLIEFHGEVRCPGTLGNGAYNDLVAVAIEGIGTDPWAC